MTTSNDRRAYRLGRRFCRRLVQFLLVLTVLTPALAATSPIPVVHADGLSDAIAEQQRIAKLIATQKAQIAKLATQQTSLQTQISQTKKNLSGVLSSLDDAQKQIDALQVLLVDAKGRYDTLSVQQRLLQTQLVDLTAQRDAKQRELEVRQAILASRMVDAYVTDQTPLLQQLLTSHSLTDALSDVSYYTDMAESDAALAAEIKANQKDLAQIEANVQLASDANQQLVDQAASQKQQLDDQNVQFSQAKTQLATMKAQLQTQLAQQQKAEAQLAKNKADLDAAIQSNGAAMDKLAAKIDDLIRREGGTGRIPSQYNGLLHWPMSGVITQDYGCTGITSEPRVGSCAHFHQGIDIATSCLAPVYAAGDGVVMFVGYNPLDRKPYQAWLVIIAHSTSLVTWYAHMTGQAPPGIREGATVKQGQLIGTENTTGRSTGCHLHWAVRVNGHFVNPRLFL